MFCKNSYLTHFSATVSKFFPKNFLHFLKKGPPNFQERDFSYILNPGITKLSYISGNGVFQPYISLIFQEVTFLAQKMKKTHS